MTKGEFVVGDGNDCPKCIKKVKLTYYPKENKIVGKCYLCGRSYDEKFTLFHNECSCGCGHLKLSVVVQGTWFNVMGACKCVNGKFKMHIIQKKTLQ